MGSLQCGVVRPRELPVKSVSFFCHGYGASGDDLVGLAPEIMRLAPLEDPTQGGTLMVFPEAPLTLEDEGMPEGRAWWLLSIQRLISALENGRYDEVKDEIPEGIDSARTALVEAISITLDQFGLDESQLLLAGFSQGSMLSMDTALRGLAKPPAKLVLYSSCLICQKAWRPLAGRLSETDIFQSHGSFDPILPLQTGKWLQELLTEGGCTVDFHEFQGIHTIPAEAIHRTAKLLASLHSA